MKIYCYQQLLCSAVLCLLLGSASVVHAQVPTAVGSLATTGAVLDELATRAQNMIDSATQNGNYLLGRAGIEARIAIENARLASLDVLSVTFKEIGKQRHDMIAGIDQVLQDAQAGVITASEAIKKIQEGGEQIGNVLDIQGHRSYVIRYLPSVVFQNEAPIAQPRIMTVRGVNLDEAKAKLEIAGNVLEPIAVLKQELKFQIPASSVTFQQATSSLVKATLSYQSVKPGFFNRLFGRTEAIKREIPIFALPVQLATVNFEPFVTTTRELERRPKRYALEQFKGVNADQPRAIAPDPNFRIDLRTLSFEQFGEGGGRSFCIGFSDEGKTEFGVTFLAHVGRISDGISGKPGFVNCRVAYDIFREGPVESPGTPVAETVVWSADKPINFVPQQTRFSITLRTFDGRERTFSANGHDKFFSVVTEPNRVVIRPTVPNDLSAN